MHDLTELKNNLYKELDKISTKGDLTTQTLDLVDKISHALKCILTIEAMDENPSYSSANSSYGTSGMSYAGNGGYSSRRDSRGRYSSHDDYVARLEDIMYTMPDERSRQDIERIIMRMRNGM